MNMDYRPRERDNRERWGGWKKDFEELKDRFNSISFIGKGTYGWVYKAERLDDKTEKYALKKINLQLHKEKDGVSLAFTAVSCDGPSRNKDFAVYEPSECSQTARYCHLKKYEVISSASLILDSRINGFRGSTFLVLEYMQHDFASMIPQVKFTMPEIKSLLAQLLKGCAYLHGCNIIHRDLKSKKS